MPLALILIGGALLITAVRGTYGQLGSQLVSDFTGSGGFLVWVAAIVIIGLLGYIEPFRTPSRLLLALVMLAILLSNKGFFANLTQAVQTSQPSQSAAIPSSETLTGSPTVTLTSGGNTTNGVGGQVASAAGTAASIVHDIPIIGGLFA